MTSNSTHQEQRSGNPALCLTRGIQNNARQQVVLSPKGSPVQNLLMASLPRTDKRYMTVELTDRKHIEDTTTPPDRTKPQGPGEWKQCPLCAETIRAAAIKCRFCGEYLDGSSRKASKPRDRQWYFKTSTVVLGLLVAGPLALPIVWMNPRYKIVTRVLITVAVLVVTILLVYLTAALYRNLIDQVKTLGVI